MRTLDRRSFLRDVATATAVGVQAGAASAVDQHPDVDRPLQSTSVSLEGYTLVAAFEHQSSEWKVYEDLRTRDGALIFVSGKRQRVLAKSAEATFADAQPPYLGLDLKDVGLSGRDLLAEKLLERGDPDPEQVRRAAPPLESQLPERPQFRLAWNTFVGTRECSDTMPVFPGGNTRTYHPIQYFPELRQALAKKRFEGLLGGWMPAVRKVMPISDTSYYELLIFGDVEAHDRFIVQTWHRTALIENGVLTKVVYGHSYPAFPPTRQDPRPEEFYRALLIFAEYWDRLLADASPVSLPAERWSNMTKHAFAKELMVRPGGVYPKYGAVDRDYYGSEYDGFQDIFTSAANANLEWHRFEQAKLTIDNYFTSFVDAKGNINMRGPETAQFGLTLSLLARYYNYTGDKALLEKHGAKIEATAALLLALHDESLRLPHAAPGYGLIHGWSESDSCLMPKPQTWWQPYFSNSAFAARGLGDLAPVWNEVGGSHGQFADEWTRRSKQLREAVIASVRANVRTDMTPAYIGPLPGTKLTFRESMATEHPSPQLWPHRAYSELLHADILPADLANTVVDCMRAYGATTLGVVANVGRPRPGDRDILGFISYGYARALLRLDRIEEYLLFLYSHGFHDHTPGSWTAGEVAGIDGDSALFCIPAQLTIPLIVRWMLVFEDSDEDRLYLGKGIPRDWMISGKEIQIHRAATRWGDVDLRFRTDLARKRVSATAHFAGARVPSEVQIRFRMPKGTRLQDLRVNGNPVTAGPDGETVTVSNARQHQFEVTGRFA